MYDLNNKQYIVKQKSGKTILILNKANSGVYSRILNKKGTWNEPTLITKDILPEYNIYSDKSDKIHVLCQDRQGHIKYIYNENEKWNSMIILKSRNFNPYDKHLSVVSDENKVHFFYTLRYSDKNLLSYQLLKSTGELSDPKVIDYVEESPNPYVVQQDSNGDIYLFYTYKDNKLSRVGYKKCIVAQNSWSDFFPITEFNGESSIIASALLSNEKMYTCWQKHTTLGYELALSIKKHGSEDWSKEKLICKSTMPFTNSSMTVLSDKILVYWIKDNSVMYTITEDNGDTWTSPKPYIFPNNDQLCCVVYICEAEDEHFSQHYNILPGTVTSGYKLAFSDEKTEEINIPAPVKTVSDDLHPLMMDSLKNLSHDIELIKKMLIDINEKLVSIENKQNQMEVELGRHNSKLMITDADLSKAIALLTELKEMNNSKQAKLETQPTHHTETPTEDTSSYNIMNHMPVMPGKGFASITPEFLRSLQKK